MLVFFIRSSLCESASIVFVYIGLTGRLFSFDHERELSNVFWYYVQKLVRVILISRYAHSGYRWPYFMTKKAPCCGDHGFVSFWCIRALHCFLEVIYFCKLLLSPGLHNKRVSQFFGGHTGHFTNAKFFQVRQSMMYTTSGGSYLQKI